MIDTRGRLIFIDFGFAMGLAPGHEFYIERAPFKFTQPNLLIFLKTVFHLDVKVLK